MSMALNPHYSNGALLLKDNNSDYWYYVSVYLSGTESYVEVDQTPITPPLDNNYAETVNIKTSNGLYYKLFIESLEGVIYTGNELLPTPLPINRIYLKDQNGLFYEAIFSLNPADGLVYLALQAIGTSVAIVNLPWRSISPATNLDPCIIVSNDFLTETTVYVPAS